MRGSLVFVLAELGEANYVILQRMMSSVDGRAAPWSSRGLGKGCKRLISRVWKAIG